jgi:hypothetical protein
LLLVAKSRFAPTREFISLHAKFPDTRDKITGEITCSCAYAVTSSHTFWTREKKTFSTRDAEKTFCVVWRDEYFSIAI